MGWGDDKNFQSLLNELPRRKRAGYPFVEDAFSYRRKRRGIQPEEFYIFL